MNPAFLKRVILPAWQRSKRQNGFELLSYLETTQWLPLGQLLDLQWRRTGELLRHAYDNVPYYGEIMRRSGADPESLIGQRSLCSLPLLDRSTISTQLSRFKATNISPDRFLPNGTGGSTGEPLRFFDDRKESAWANAAVWRSQRWVGADVGDRCSYFWGASFDLSKFQGLRGRIKSHLLNMQVLPAWELGDRTASRFWNRLCEFRPRLLLGYAGAVYEWARLLGNSRDPIPGLSAIIVSAETLYDDWRRVIEETFKVPVYNRYGGRDIQFVAQECPARKGLHINSENVLVEILRNGEPAVPGEPGEVVVTRLDNFAMPFIRYKSGDLGVIARFPCECGRSLPLLEKVEGRVQDAIVTADGRIVSGLLFAHMMKDCLDVKEFQVHQLAIDRLLIDIVLQRGEPFSSRQRIEQIVRQYMGDNLDLTFEIRDTIPLTASGKRRITISHLIGSEH